MAAVTNKDRRTFIEKPCKSETALAATRPYVHYRLQSAAVPQKMNEARQEASMAGHRMVHFY